jgi:general secretion pathway protein G
MEGGFTLIELLIVIVVLGILAAVVVFALGGVTGKSTIAACKADGTTVNTAIAAAVASNPNLYSGATVPSGQTAITAADLTEAPTTGVTGGPFLQSWPSNAPHYAFAMTASGQLAISLNPGTFVTGEPTASVTAATLGTTAADIAAAQLSPTTSSGVAWYLYTGPSMCNLVVN